MSSAKKTTIVIIIIAAIAGGYFYTHRTDDKNKQVQQQKVRVRTQVVERSSIPVIINAVGNVIAEQSVAIKSRLDSQIVSVNFKEGQNVKAGDLLFVLDDRSIMADLKQQQANLEKERSQMENLRSQYERSKELAKKGFRSDSALDDAKAAYDAQKGSYGAIDAASDNIKVQLEYAKIRAPISGRTGTINIKAGNTVKANDTALVTINQISPIAVQFTVPQQYLENVRKYLAADTLAVSATSQSLKEPALGKIEYINNEIDQSTGSFIVKAIFENADEKLWPGMFVNLRLSLGMENDVISIPEQSLQQGQSGDFVFVAVNNKAAKRQVKLVRTSQGRAIISEGVDEGEVVITDGLQSLTDGTDIIPSGEDKKVGEPKASELVNDAAETKGTESK